MPHAGAVFPLFVAIFFVSSVAPAVGYFSLKSSRRAHDGGKHSSQTTAATATACDCNASNVRARSLWREKLRQRGRIADILTPEILEREACACKPSFFHFAGPPIEGGVWPLPQKIHYDSVNRTVGMNNLFFKFRGFAKPSCDIVKFAIDTYTNKWLFPARKHSQHGGRLTINLHMHEKCPDNDEYPQQNMNETYYLRIPASGDAVLEAGEVWGLLRGLETLSQLVFRANGSFVVRTATVRDWPEYPTRGVLIDTSRHYLSKNVILRQIDIMAQNKMNVLHWHIVDIESFPYVSKTFKNLSSGAYSRAHVYSPNTVQEIIRYGRLRGIRVMVEFDTPGHMTSWEGEDGLLTECKDPDGRLMPPALIDPTEERNYEFLKQFFKEILDVFPERYVHLGGDESGLWIGECWENNPKIQKFIKDHNINGTTGLFRYYNHRLIAIVDELLENRDMLSDSKSKTEGRTVFWDEAFEAKPSTNAIIHLWRTHNRTDRRFQTEAITAAGYNVIVSSCWYLNLIQYGSDWFGSDDNHSSYMCDPRDFNGTEEQKERVLGGIAAMWGEYVDGTNLEARLWPRASTVAERLWSSSKTTHSPHAAWPRLHEHRCRLISRGYRAQPIYGADFCPDEFND